MHLPVVGVDVGIALHVERGDLPGAGPAAHRLGRRLDADGLPRLAEVAGRWASLTAGGTYLDGLRALVHGLLAQR